MQVGELFGYAASLLVFAAFYMEVHGALLSADANT